MARGTGGKTVNRQELAEILGVSLPTVNAWVKEKMPYVQKGARGRDWQFDTAAVFQWRYEQGERLNEERLTLEQIEEEAARVKLEHEKLKYAKAANLVVPLDQVERRLSCVFVELRTNMRNIPDRITPSIVGEKDEKRIKELLCNEIDMSLSVISNFNTNELDESIDVGHK